VLPVCNSTCGIALAETFVYKIRVETETNINNLGFRMISWRRIGKESVCMGCFSVVNSVCLSD
jgi:hypothetical protein